MTSFWIAAILINQATAADLRITVCDRGNLGRGVLEETFRDVARIFRLAGIDVKVTLPTPRAGGACSMRIPEPPEPGREVEAACATRRDVALEIAPDRP